MLKSPNPPRPTTIDELLDSRLVGRLSQLDLSSRKIFAGKLKGERRSKKRGESVEFADHRPYALGDDLRHIDWNIYGRLDRLFMKMFLEEEDLSLHIVIDASASGDTGEPNKFFYMQQVAMSMAYIGLVNLNRVAITALGTRDPAIAPMGEQGIAGSIRDLRGRRRTRDVARFLCSLTPEGTTDFGRAAKRIAMTRRGKGIMLVMSDFFMKEGYETGLRLLAGRGYDVFALQVLAPQEVNPEIAGDLRLVDIEDQDHAEVTISAPLLKKYKQNLSAYCEDLRTFCARREISALTIQTDTPVDTLLLDYMRKRGVLR